MTTPSKVSALQGQSSGNIIGGPEFVWDEAQNVTGKKTNVLQLAPSSNLTKRKMYLAIRTDKTAFIGQEFFVRGLLNFFLGNTPVGSYPAEYGCAGVTNPTNMIRSSVSVGTTSSSNTLIDGIFVAWSGLHAGETELSTIVAPQNFDGVFDRVQLDVVEWFNVGWARFFVGLMSNSPSKQ